MTPTSHCYFDYYQGSPVNEPLAIGGYIPLEKVYVYEPIPAQLNAQQAKYILGAQANIWTEYITNPDQVEYMAIPRMLALSEVLWSEKGKRDYDAFVQRLLFHFKLLDNINCNYSKSIYKITFSIKPDENYNGIWAYMSSPFENDNFYFAISSNAEQYLMEGTYKNPIAISSSCKVSGVSEKLKPEAKNYNSISISFNKATGKKISLTSPPSKKYAADGAFTLVNGIVATTKPNWAANEWLGFEGTDCETMIDLGKTDTIKKITVGYLEDKLSWIWAAGSVEVFASADGINFMKIDLQTFQKDERNAILSFVPFTTQCIKLKIKNYGDIPSGNPGAGKRAWLFVDEISIE
jgi:hexosaminidase